MTCLVKKRLLTHTHTHVLKDDIPKFHKLYENVHKIYGKLTYSKFPRIVCHS